MIVGLDMGGTHIDAIIVKNNKILKVVKRPTDYNNIFNSIWETLKELFSDVDTRKIKKINLSTTISTNAIVEDKVSKVGLIIQSGPGLPNDHLKVGNKNSFITGYTDHRGKVVGDYNSKELNDSIHSFKSANIKEVGIVCKFSTRNPQTELAIKDDLSKDFDNFTLGHQMSGKLNFPRRVNTAFLNAAVKKTFNNFAKNIELALAKEGINAPVAILKSDGGVMSLAAATKMPVETILSGPAASLMGITSLLNTKQDAILLDIGGTTTDIFFLADGISLFEPLGITINNHKTLVRSIYSSSIGLGGDSSITIVNNELKIGPIRQGRPYALGGPMITPTDAMIVLDYLNIGNKELASKGIKVLADKLELNVEQAANKILRQMAKIIKEKTDELLTSINSKPVYTVKRLLENKQLKPKRINIIGGPAKVLTKYLANEYNLDVYYPKHYEVANAIGAAIAITTTEINMVVNTAMQTLSVPELGIYEKVNKNYNVSKARKRAFELLTQRAISLGAKKEDLELEIIEESVFNMIDGFYTKGKNIRIKAQVKPGINIKGMEDYYA